MTIQTKFDLERMHSDEEYFYWAESQIDHGHVKLTNKEYGEFQLILHKWNMKNVVPSQNPAHHENAYHRVRRVGLSRFFQDLSDFFN